LNSIITASQIRRIAILQSNYIPWKGYFDIIRSVDDFVIYDDVQFTKNDWRNRNRIKTSHGLQWLTIPVQQKQLVQTINETKTANNSWAIKHWKTICQNYSKSTYFDEYKELFEYLYLRDPSMSLSEINLSFIKTINRVLGITTRIHLSSDYQQVNGRTERLVDLCKQFHATEYISGPAAKSYIHETLFHQENITLSWADYRDYPEYRQRHPPFEHGVTVMDLIFNEGWNATRYTKRF
jgi:hypothetical protein